MARNDFVAIRAIGEAQVRGHLDETWRAQPKHRQQR
jgi:hypothetical protein